MGNTDHPRDDFVRHRRRRTGRSSTRSLIAQIIAVVTALAGLYGAMDHNCALKQADAAAQQVQMQRAIQALAEVAFRE